MKTFLLFAALLVCGQSSAQLVNSILDHNNTSVLVSNGGILFNDNGSPGYEVPKGSGNHALQALQFWYSGKDSLGQIHENKGGLPTVGTDIFNGPHSDSSNYGPTYQNTYAQGVWSICQWEIDQYKAWWAYDNGISAVPAPVPNNYILDKINYWPGHGNVSNGEQYWMAPYYDYDSDGSYNPTQGDHPLIKGCCASWMVHNDSDTAHFLTNGFPLGIQLKTMVYQYKTWGTYLDNVTFIDLEIVNFGEKNLTDFHYGVYAEAALGNTGDNYFGSDSTTNLMYFYNQDNDDDNSYGVNPPAIGIVALDQNATAITKHFSQPITYSIDNVLNGLEASGVPYTHPDGHTTKYQYSENPNDPMGWSEYVLANSPVDVGGVISTNHGDLDTMDVIMFIPDTLRQTYAIIYQDGGDHLQNVTNLIAQAAEVKLFFDNESNMPCEGAIWGIEENELAEKLGVYPNPTDGRFSISNEENLELSFSVIDVTGKVIVRGENSSESSIQVDLTDVPSGMYLVQITSESGSVVKKVIVE